MMLCVSVKVRGLTHWCNTVTRLPDVCYSKMTKYRVEGALGSLHV